RDDGIRSAAEVGEDGGFMTAKAFLAFRREHFADAAAQTCLQLNVGVDPGAAEPLRQQPGHRSLAGAARADEEDDHSSSSLSVTGDRARLITLAISATGGSLPVNRRTC